MNLKGKKRIISFGCSFTSGAELIDHELLGISFDDCNKMKHKWTSDKIPMHEFEDYVTRNANLTSKQYINMCSKRSYVYKLADKLGLEHVNYAVPGSAVDHMVLNLFQAYHTQQINPETDIIFLGITTPHRYLTFSPERTGAALSRVMDYYHVQDSDMHYNDYKIMQTYFFALQNFKNFCIANNFDFYLQPVPPIKLLFYNDTDPKTGNMFADINSAWSFLPIFKKLFEDIMQYSVSSNLSLFSGHDRTFCGFMHPTETAHERFSQELYDKIVANQN
jgi:hypothetical protein